MGMYILKRVTRHEGSSTYPLKSDKTLEELLRMYEALSEEYSDEYVLVYSLEEWLENCQYPNDDLRLDLAKYERIQSELEGLQALADEEYAGVVYPEYPEP